MTEYSGVVTLDEDDVHVMVGLEGDKISLVAGEVSIGEWGAGEYVVVDLGRGTFVIEAGEGSISFHPDDPGAFALRIGQDQESRTASESVASSWDTVEIKEGPRPNSSTMIGFYALVMVTTALGVWALISLF